MTPDTFAEYIYTNELETDRFARMLNDPTQCYKFYWLDAIMVLFPGTVDDLSFNDVFDEMICSAWYSVTTYHLHLGPLVNGNYVNLLERAVCIIEKDTELTKPATKQDILSAIKRNEKELYECKRDLAKNVPYRLLSSFMDEICGNDRIWDHKKRLIEYITELNKSVRLPYTVVDGRSLQKKIHIDLRWKEFLLDNYSVIRGWIRLNKVRFLQDRNPGVPGIIYKLDDNHEEGRKLEEVRKLWKEASKVSGKPIIDIYTGNDLAHNKFALDHFVPWSYIANDELWNLIPVDPVINSSKGNSLPEWDKFFVPFSDRQYCLFNTVVSNTSVREQFERCRKNNLNTIWANELLYIENNTRTQFTSILEQHLRPIYESAKLQGFKVWTKTLV